MRKGCESWLNILLSLRTHSMLFFCMTLNEGEGTFSLRFISWPIRGGSPCGRPSKPVRSRRIRSGSKICRLWVCCVIQLSPGCFLSWTSLGFEYCWWAWSSLSTVLSTSSFSCLSISPPLSIRSGRCYFFSSALRARGKSRRWYRPWRACWREGRGVADVLWWSHCDRIFFCSFLFIIETKNS